MSEKTIGDVVREFDALAVKFARFKADHEKDVAALIAEKDAMMRMAMTAKEDATKAVATERELEKTALEAALERCSTMAKMDSEWKARALKAEEELARLVQEQ